MLSDMQETYLGGTDGHHPSGRISTSTEKREVGSAAR